MTPKIMYYNILIADSIENDNDLIFTLQEGLPTRIVPKALFKNSSTTATLKDIKEWVKYRIPPKNRQDLKEILSELKLKKYEPIEFAFKSGASVVGDGWWIKTEENQTYHNHSIRGKLNYPEKTLEDFKDWGIYE